MGSVEAGRLRHPVLRWEIEVDGTHIRADNCFNGPECC